MTAVVHTVSVRSRAAVRRQSGWRTLIASISSRSSSDRPWRDTRGTPKAGWVRSPPLRGPLTWGSPSRQYGAGFQYPVLVA
ncbi:MAG: hypothetical protein ACKVWR_07985 [Acidimicrobiales bacterium]